MSRYEILDKVNMPRDLDGLTLNEKISLCGEIRDFLIETVTETGGHLASNLGTVELTVAIHSVFNAPYDRIIFDVGHQAYTHKILTGRKDRFDKLRKRGGLSGFTKTSESEYDCFGAGHSSTSLSAALGFCEADRLAGNDAYTVVVLGDGAFTGGMIHEALNNVKSDSRLVIILNENEMSISKNIGHFAELLSKIRSRKGYYKTKRFTVDFIKGIPLIGNALFKFIRDVKKRVKNFFYGSNYFENMGLYYLGPCDGNNLETVTTLFEEAKEYGKACVVHLKTKKGKGYAEAEKNPSAYHSVSPRGKKSNSENFSKHMGKTLSRLADNDEKICAITASMADGTGLGGFSADHKDRFFDVGIAEEHALTFSAGLAANGLKPYFAVYSSFMQRGIDSIIHDIALQNLPVRILIDRAEIAEADGPTHNGVFDVAILSSVPNVDIYTPSSFDSLDKALEESVSADKPTVIRYPNKCDNSFVTEKYHYVSDYIRTDFDINNKPKNIIVTYGQTVNIAEQTEKEFDCKTVLIERLTPYSSTCEKLKEIIGDNSSVVFLEEGMKINGAGAIIGKMLCRKKYAVVGIDGVFDTDMASGDYFTDYGIGYKDVIKAFEELNG